MASGPGAALAWLMQKRRSPVSPTPAPVSPVLTTVNVAGASRCSSSSTRGTEHSHCARRFLFGVCTADIAGLGHHRANIEVLLLPNAGPTNKHSHPDESTNDAGGNQRIYADPRTGINPAIW